MNSNQTEKSKQSKSGQQIITNSSNQGINTGENFNKNVEGMAADPLSKTGNTVGHVVNPSVDLGQDNTL